MLRKIDALFAYFTLAIFYFNVDKCLKPQKKRLIKILLENYKKPEHLHFLQDKLPVLEDLQ